jgi:nitrite reductase/ring-hydroxylating ferredoxin subunit/uncharacterized membrane protein
MRNSESFHTTALYLLIAGVLMAIIAAVPGLIDFLYTVPPKSSAKKRAAQHAVINVCMVALFSIALAYRLTREVASFAVVLALEGTGVALMSYAGWLGGTLVHRNQIGVDPRYAFAGTWKEEYIDQNKGLIMVGKADDLKRDQMKLLHLLGRRIVLARTSDGYVAFEDRCTHRGGSLAGGMTMCDTVQCPWHGSQFDVRTGAVKAGPADKKILVYKIENAQGILYLNLEN